MSTTGVPVSEYVEDLVRLLDDEGLGDHPCVAQLVTIVMSLAGELAVSRQREQRVAVMVKKLETQVRDHIVEMRREAAREIEALRAELRVRETQVREHGWRLQDVKLIQRDRDGTPIALIGERRT